jgi:hypothetical protein
MPNLKFLVAWKSQEWQDLVEAEQNGSIAARFPRSPKPRAATGMTQEVVEGMMYEFNSQGIFKTQEERLAGAAFCASRDFNAISRGITFVDEYSQPISPEFTKERPKRRAKANSGFQDAEGFAISKAAARQHQEQAAEKQQRKAG